MHDGSILSTHFPLTTVKAIDKSPITRPGDAFYAIDRNQGTFEIFSFNTNETRLASELRAPCMS